jgi:polar amino acid transport system substrate-binding protein
MLAPLLLAILLAAIPAQAADKAPLRYIEKVDGMLSPDQQPTTEFQDKLGAALARQLGRPVQYVQLPRTRLMPALESGDADILCSYLPEWLPGEADWTNAFIPVSEMVVSSPRVKAPTSLEELRGKRLGTVLGFHYPELEQTLGNDYIRDDAPSSTLSIRKWQAGRFDYMMTQRSVLNKMIREGKLPHGHHIMVVYEVKTKCAVSRKSKITVDEINAAINALAKSGALAAILRLR